MIAAAINSSKLVENTPISSSGKSYRHANPFELNPPHSVFACIRYGNDSWFGEGDVIDVDSGCADVLEKGDPEVDVLAFKREEVR